MELFQDSRGQRSKEGARGVQGRNFGTWLESWRKVLDFTVVKLKAQVNTRDECLSPRVRLECNPEIPVAPGEEHWLLDTKV